MVFAFFKEAICSKNMHLSESEMVLFDIVLSGGFRIEIEKVLIDIRKTTNSLGEKKTV